jgi:hypothetical protein
MDPSSSNNRKHKRLHPENTFVINQQCVCRVLNFSQGGLSFGCPSEREVPDIMAIDIIDNSGLKIYNLSVETIWAGENKDTNTESIYKMIVGVKFNKKNSYDQQVKLDQLTRLIKKDGS